MKFKFSSFMFFAALILSGSTTRHYSLDEDSNGTESDGEYSAAEIKTKVKIRGDDLVYANEDQ